jgi:hypothetical protein
MPIRQVANLTIRKLEQSPIWKRNTIQSDSGNHFNSRARTTGIACQCDSRATVRQTHTNATEGSNANWPAKTRAIPRQFGSASHCDTMPISWPYPNSTFAAVQVPCIVHDVAMSLLCQFIGGKGSCMLSPGGRGRLTNWNTLGMEIPRGGSSGSNRWNHGRIPSNCGRTGR